MTISLGQPGIPYKKPIPENAATYKPTHPGLVRVILETDSKPESSGGEDTYSSYLVAEKDIPANSIVTPLSNLSSGPKAYSSIQYGSGPDDHFELNSDLLFVNHSCEPNVFFDLSTPRTSPISPYPSSWCLRTKSKPIKKGEMLTFFYPSTEWEMGAPFKCECNTQKCLGMIVGAKALSRSVLDAQELINPHILQLKGKQSTNTAE